MRMKLPLVVISGSFYVKNNIKMFIIFNSMNIGIKIRLWQKY